jgi:transcriptional regulator with XRE-family HTH domain
MRDLGDLIRSAREAKGVTIEEASADTRIRRAYLEAIEDGDFRIFPGAAYSTGFLRNYAAYLGLNVDEVLQTYHALSPVAGITIEPATTVGVERLRRRARRKMSWTAVAVLLVGVSTYGIVQYNQSQVPPAAGPHVKVPTSTPSIPGSSIPLNGDHGNGDQIPSHGVRGSAVIRVRAHKTVWVRIVRNKHRIFWGPITAGQTRTWHGHYLKISTHRGTALTVWVDGTRTWRISKSTGKFTLAAGPYTWHHVRHHHTS